MAQGLQISLSAGASALSPEQKRFNTLIRQIEQARQTLAAWHEQFRSMRKPTCNSLCR
jgi:hypothetical protein